MAELPLVTVCNPDGTPLADLSMAGRKQVARICRNVSNLNGTPPSAVQLNWKWPSAARVLADEGEEIVANSVRDNAHVRPLPPLPPYVPFVPSAEVAAQVAAIKAAMAVPAVQLP